MPTCVIYFLPEGHSHLTQACIFLVISSYQHFDGNKTIVLLLLYVHDLKDQHMLWKDQIVIAHTAFQPVVLIICNCSLGVNVGCNCELIVNCSL